MYFWVRAWLGVCLCVFILLATFASNQSLFHTAFLRLPDGYFRVVILICFDFFFVCLFLFVCLFAALNRH